MCILAMPSPTQRIEVGNWSLSCLRPGELIIQNIADGEKVTHHTPPPHLYIVCLPLSLTHPYIQNTQRTILKANFSGFEFESNRSTKHKFVAETSFARLLSNCNHLKSKNKQKIDHAKSKVPSYL